MLSCWSRDLQSSSPRSPTVEQGTDLAWFVMVDPAQGEFTHAYLTAKGLLDGSFNPQEHRDLLGFPLVAGEQIPPSAGALEGLAVHHTFQHMPATPRRSVDPHVRLSQAVEDWATLHAFEAKDGLCASTPAKWERLGELILFPATLLDQQPWREAGQHDHATDLWRAMAGALKVQSLGVQAPIADDIVRSSQVKMLLGESNVVMLDHGITYVFDAAKVMFSSGNITERRRIGAMDMTGEIVIDAYAGIGYYTLPMLVHGGAAHVHACELNPPSIEALMEGAMANEVNDRLTVHPGDNALSLQRLKGIADRCHLGLLPSSEAVWDACLLALKPSGGMLHIHMNVEEERIGQWVDNTVARFEALALAHGLARSFEAVHLERVKWYAPFVRHVVLDLAVRPSEVTAPIQRP